MGFSVYSYKPGRTIGTYYLTYGQQQGWLPENVVGKGKIQCSGNGINEYDEQFVCIGLLIGHTVYSGKYNQNENAHAYLYKTTVQTTEK